MKVRFWGVRGSIPVPGPSTNRYGGNTSCVEVRPRGADPFVIDAGTGIRRLGKHLMEGRFGEGAGTAHILISHTHWDHIQGMPFFSPLYRAGNKMHVFARQRGDTHLQAVFASQTEDPYFPVPLPSPNRSSISALPRRRMPVPASMMIGQAPRGRTSTHDVFPP